MTDRTPTEALSGAIAEIVVPSSGIAADMPFFTKTLGFRLDKIFPADDPAVAILSAHGVRRDTHHFWLFCVRGTPV